MQRIASAKIIRRLLLQISFIKARHIGFYWPVDGEVDITGLISDSLRNWYLPLISDQLRPWESQQLLFQPYFQNSIHAFNKFGIIEPHYSPKALFNPMMLDVVLLPLVGFDRSGNRLGMGKGYYDRTFKRIKTAWHKPMLIGISHSVQEYPDLGAQSWDIPLEAVVTEKEIIWS